MSFREVKEHGIPKDVDVLINAGDAMTAFSGGEEWADPALTAKIRQWVYHGGGFLGVGEPSACHAGDAFFSLQMYWELTKSWALPCLQINILRMCRRGILFQRIVRGRMISVRA